MRILETKLYKIDEHPDKDKCFDWIRDNWYYLNEHSVHELINSINALSNLIGGSVSYSISQFPDRNEHIIFKDYDHEKLCRISAGDCPLTGVFWDIEVITGLRTGTINKVLDSLHDETNHVYSDEYLFEFCLINEYEFTENGICI